MEKIPPLTFLKRPASNGNRSTTKPPVDLARRTITGQGYALTLPTYAAARDFARATTELTRQGFSRDQAVRRLADRINVTLNTHPQ